VLCTQPWGVAVSGSYAYVTAVRSDSLVVVDISNPASPVIRGSVVSSSLLDGVREARSCGRGCFGRAPRHASITPRRPRHHRLLIPSTLSLARSHVLCLQAEGVALSGSYAYVAAHLSDSLVVVDVSNPASPVIRGSVVSSSLLDYVRVRPGALRARMVSGAALASATPIVLAPAAPLADTLSRSHLRVLAVCAQAVAVAVSGLYAYVTASYSASLVVVDISNPLSPVIRGSVVSSSLGDVGVALRCVHLARVRVLKLSRALTRSLSRAAHR
jgi:hypothetical protein